MKTQIKKEAVIPVTLSVTFENDEEFKLFKKFLGKTNRGIIKEIANCNETEAITIHDIIYSMYSNLYDYTKEKI